MSCCLPVASPDGGIGSQCDAACNNVYTNNCPVWPGVDPCISGCEYDRAIDPGCTPAFDALTGCIAGLDGSGFECNAAGATVITAGSCVAQKSAFCTLGCQFAPPFSGGCG
jgi:hypothetical protein